MFCTVCQWWKYCKGGGGGGGCNLTMWALMGRQARGAGQYGTWGGEEGQYGTAHQLLFSRSASWAAHRHCLDPPPAHPGYYSDPLQLLCSQMLPVLLLLSAHHHLPWKQIHWGQQDISSHKTLSQSVNIGLMTNRFVSEPCNLKTLPKAQRALGLSSAYQSNLIRSYRVVFLTGPPKFQC